MIAVWRRSDLMLDNLGVSLSLSNEIRNALPWWEDMSDEEVIEWVSRCVLELSGGTVSDVL